MVFLLVQYSLCRVSLGLIGSSLIMCSFLHQSLLPGKLVLFLHRTKSQNQWLSPWGKYVSICLWNKIEKYGLLFLQKNTLSRKANTGFQKENKNKAYIYHSPRSMLQSYLLSLCHSFTHKIPCDSIELCSIKVRIGSSTYIVIFSILCGVWLAWRDGYS